MLECDTVIEKLEGNEASPSKEAEAEHVSIAYDDENAHIEDYFKRLRNLQ